MNVKGLMKQCEMVLVLSNGVTNNEIGYLYKTAKQMVDENNKSKHLIFRDIPEEINLVDLCNYMRNLRVWNFYVIGELKSQYKFQEVARLREIIQIGDEFAVKYRL